MTKGGRSPPLPLLLPPLLLPPLLLPPLLLPSPPLLLLTPPLLLLLPSPPSGAAAGAALRAWQ
jgi:hypothetical protein